MHEKHSLLNSTLISIIIVMLGTGVAAAAEVNSTANTKSGSDVGGIWEGRGSNSGGEIDGFVLKFEIRDGIIKFFDVDYYYNTTKECDKGGFNIPKGSFIKDGYSDARFEKNYPEGLGLINGSFDIVSEESEHIHGKIYEDSTFKGTFELSSPCIDIVIPWEAKKHSDKPHDSPRSSETEEACRARLKAKCESTMQGKSAQYICFEAKYDIVCANTVGY